ncbi:FERM and PDZ domain-containing protein 1 isoform X2 [Anarrhichthys ocellatus]|uniref:FERM and PDZ domain-containing protein 1 isoform X2 n=1 Tax=Anarrhichthys ocellatus TaxID=433405 RepID=UPI0012EE12BE|nr:FERM and PDZ domain-containing protein 1-like isoform X2 [Anarrhichthys ocellatus]
MSMRIWGQAPLLTSILSLSSHHYVSDITLKNFARLTQTDTHSIMIATYVCVYCVCVCVCVCRLWISLCEAGVCICTKGPKSSFITPEKRAKLRSNPVKVHFAEEVEVNGHSQGNSLLFLPNVLKVYLENGQTKAFKFDPSTTVKDIVMTLKEKLPLSHIEHFSLVLEQQHSISKLLLLHEEERIQQVVQKKEAHDYRCLFRVCFMPKTLQTLLQEDHTAFEYLYLQGVNDVLQERFAIEMRCNTALRLAALHIQERLASCGQSPKTNLKIITKTWGIENFVSSTLLRNMREKDLRKAIGYHMKKSQSQNDPKQKGLSVDQTRINYLEELSDLKSFGGKSFSATMMLQDRESMVTLLVGARYGVSQVVNHKLGILSTLTEFTSITRIELLPESDKVSLVKIYLQDIKPITLLLESTAAKDMSCLIAGYCRVFIDPNLNVFPWIHDFKKHRVSAEEGYVSRCGSDSDTSSDLDMEALVTLVSHDERPCHQVRSSSDPEGRKRKDRNRRRNKDGKERGDKPWENKKQKEEKDADTEKEKSPLDKNRERKNEDAEHKEETERAQDGRQTWTEITDNDSGEHGEKMGQEGGDEVRAAEEQPSVSEASDSCNTDSRVITSPSMDSLDALEEDDLISCSSSSIHSNVPSQIHSHSPIQLHPYSHRRVQPHLLAPPPAHAHPLIHLTTHDRRGGDCRRSGDGADPQFLAPVSPSPPQYIQKCSSNPGSDDGSMCFAELSRLVDFLPSPPEASEDDEEEELRRRRRKSARRAGERGSVNSEGSFKEHLLSPSPSSHIEFVFNFDQSDARCYYKLCSNITPDSARSLPRPLHHNEGEPWEEVEEDPAKAVDLEPIPILQPPPGFGDSSSEEEFFDARDRFTSPEDPTLGAMHKDILTEMKLDFLSTLSLSDIRVSVTEADKDGKEEEDRKEGDEEGGGRETLFQLRKRSRKRRSFMETDYTSRVSYPEPDPKMQDLVSSRLHKNLVAEANDAQMLSSDPEPSEQTQNPSPTVSSLTHSEGEPAQLESKTILSKPHSHGPGSPCGLGSHEQTRDPQATSRARKQEMEMEPDAMESKSVTDLVNAASPTITVVRCRVDPDGKESADRRGDGKEEREEQEEMSEGKEEGEEEETGGVSGKGTFTNQMFLTESTEEEGKGGKEKREGVRENSSSSKRPLIGAERQPEANTMPTCLIDGTKKRSNGLLGAHLIALEQNLYVQEQMLEGVCEKSNPPSYSPPPPSPSSPLPPTPVLNKSQSDCYLRGEEGSENTGTSTKMSSSYSEEMPQRHTNKAQLHLDVTTSIIEDDANGVVSSTMTISDEVTDSTNSDNVFFDDDMSNSLTSSSSDKKDEWAIATRHSISATLATASEDESQIIIKSPTNTEAHTRISSVNSDYTRAINSITAKLGVATTATSPIFNSSTRLRCEVTNENASSLDQNVDKPIRDSTMHSAEAKNSLGSPSLAKANPVTIHNPSKTPPSPTHFLFQTCSPNIMVSLSAATLRGKIQQLSLYLSRSQETLHQAGVGDVPQSSAEDSSRDEVEITIKVTDVDDVTKTIDFETGTTAESVESDDSDTTVTGSEVDGEIFVETNSAKSFQSVSEVKELSRPSPVQTEPKPQHQHLPLYTGPIKNTPGPITEPPASIVNSLQRDSSGLNMDTPGPIKDTPESKMKVTTPGEDIPDFKMNNQSRSIAHPIVVTTQNLNGPGLPFHSPAQKVRRTSSDRPLMGLCRPAGQNSDSTKTLSSGCRVFTICEDPSQTKSLAMVGTTPPLKPEFGCTSVLASGCESVVEGLQVPLEACGCPTVYTNCFSSGDSFDEELTVYEFSCRTQSSGVTQTSGAGLPLMTSPPVSSFLSTSSPSFPRSNLFSSNSELSPLLSPLSDSSDRFLPQTHKDTISWLGQQRYPEPPTGFQVLRIDVDQLLSILESTGADKSIAGHGGRHPRDTCPAHFTENKRVLQIEARRLMSGCQKVVGIGQSPEEMLHSLADSFRTLVELAGICLWFSGCERCDRRNAEAIAGLADVARSFRDFCLAAERASSKRSCQDLSSKLLAKQCTALTASVFCLTQLFRTLTAL